MPGCSLCVSAAGRERALIKEPLHTGLMQPDSLISLSAGISARPGSTSTSATSPRTLSRLYLSLRCGPGRVCAACFSRSGPPARLSPSGLPPPQVLARDSPPTAPPARAVSRLPPPFPARLPPLSLASSLPPPLLHLFSLFSPLTRTLPPAGAPLLHGKTQWFPQKTQLWNKCQQLVECFDFHSG